MKKCSVCKKTKPLEEFHNKASSKDGKGYRCKPCDKEAREKWAKENPERDKLSRRARQLKYKYGIALEDYERMFKEQKGRCKICNTDEPRSAHGTKVFAVDHCHETGKVRGLLCSKCNRALGLFGDDPSVLAKAIEYLEEETND